MQDTVRYDDKISKQVLEISGQTYLSDKNVIPYKVKRKECYFTTFKNALFFV